MYSVSVDHPEWLDTFPHRITPSPDEWLPGFLLRCDEENGWLSGTTANFVCLPTRKGYLQYEHYFIAARHLDLVKLAQLLSIPLNTLLATTFRSSLMRLYGHQAPDTREFGDTVLLQICPACIGEARLLRFSTALPKVAHCPVHLLTLQRECSCGASLKIFHTKSKPFTCYACGQDWSQFARIPVDPERLKVEVQYLSLYMFFLTEGSWLTYIRTRYLVREEYKYAYLPFFHTSESSEVTDDSDVTESKVTTNSFYHEVFPLSALVAQLVKLGFSARDVALNAFFVPGYKPSCLNHACPLFEVSDKQDIALYDYYYIPLGSNEPIWCCMMCGSCFVGNRLYLTFDQDCAGSESDILYPTSDAILVAQEQLLEWTSRLESACQRLVGRGEEIEVIQAFEEADVPFSPNLLAQRLGLVKIIKEYSVRQWEVRC